MRRLPSINALRAFEAAARTLSFVAASDELCVTPAAVSQQIKSLELLLNVKLFMRVGRSVRLTEAGQRWLPEVRGCIRNIESTVAKATKLTSHQLTITVAPSFASRLLINRLHRFSAVAPDITVRVIATPEVVDLNEQEIDVAIRYGNGHHPAFSVSPLMAEYLIPMCAPSLVEHGPPLDRPEDLVRHRLIHDESTAIDGGAWSLWLQVMGATDLEPLGGPRFTIADLALQSAMDGQGVVLARWQLAISEVRSGRLICPFNVRIRSPYSYVLVARHDAAESEKTVSFRQWLQSEMKEEQGRCIAAEYGIETR